MNKIPDPNPDLQNRDPLTNEPGAHPVGAGVGAAAGGIAGGAIGALAGPVGAVVGAAAGSFLGGLAGKDFAEGVNPTVEDEYWMKNYHRESYIQPGMTYEDYRPAYRVGYQTYPQHRDNPALAEEEMRQAWDKNKGLSRLEWEHARHAARAGYDRVAIANTDTVRIGV